MKDTKSFMAAFLALLAQWIIVQITVSVMGLLMGALMCAYVVHAHSVHYEAAKAAMACLTMFLFYNQYLETFVPFALFATGLHVLFCIILIALHVIGRLLLYIERLLRKTIEEELKKPIKALVVPIVFAGYMAFTIYDQLPLKPILQKLGQARQNLMIKTIGYGGRKVMESSYPENEPEAIVYRYEVFTDVMDWSGMIQTRDGKQKLLEFWRKESPFVFKVDP